MNWKLSFCIVLIFATGLTFAQTPLNHLTGTKWGSKRMIGCVETYTFKNDKEFEYYNCEMEVTRIGDYSIVQDTLKVMVYHIDDVPAFAGGTGEQQLRFQYNFIIREDTLELIYQRDFKFPSELTIKGITFTQIQE
ncbi:MAG: hypothetical protein JXQ90_24105 [Cyclobacteriaceae bacterium]